MNSSVFGAQTREEKKGSWKKAQREAGFIQTALDQNKIVNFCSVSEVPSTLLSAEGVGCLHGLNQAASEGYKEQQYLMMFNRTDQSN